MGCFSSSKQKLRSTPTMTSPQQSMFDQIMSMANQGVSNQYQGYQGQRVAPLSAMTQQGLGMMGRGSQFATNAAQQGLSVLGQAGQGQGGMFDAITNQAMNMWDRRISPGILAKFAGMDGTSSSGARDALIRGGTDLSLGLAGQLAPMQMNALGMIPSLAGIPGAEAGRMITAGQVPQQQQQQQLGARQDLFMEQQPFANPYVNLAMGTATTPMQEYYLKTSGAGLGASLLGGMASGMGGPLGEMAAPALGGMISGAGGLMAGGLGALAGLI